MDERNKIDSCREAGLLYRTIFEQSPDGILLIDTDGAFIEFNEAAHTQLGYSRREFEKLHISNIDPFQSPDEVEASLRTVLEEGMADFEVQHVTKHGEIRDVRIITKVVNLSGRTLFHTIWRDITSRRRALNDLEEATAWSESLIAALSDGISVQDTNLKVLFQNQVHKDLLGDHQGQYCYQAYDHREDRCEDCPVAKSLLDGRIYKTTRSNPFPEGMRHFEITASPVKDSEGRIIAGLEVVREITDRKRAEEALRKSEELVRNILDSVDEGFIVVDKSFRILTANRAYCSAVGENYGEVLGRRCYEIACRFSRPCHEEGKECPVYHVLKTGQPHTAVHRTRDVKGAFLCVETKAFPIKDASGAITSVIETINNITEKHLLEEERLKAEKMAAIGTLAGGIAHDFNNLLQGIFGYISMAKRTIDERERCRSMLEQAEKALHLSVNLTTQLLTFSRGGKPIKKKTDLRPAIENAVKFALSGSNVDYRIVFEEELLMVEADEGQIAQVIQNIVLNADQAMPLGGMVLITAGNLQESKKDLLPCLNDGAYIEISVQDSGIGIPEHFLPKIFDPYFTTKEKGSGLGLATSYSIVAHHGGVIDVASEIGNGTIFSVYLPAIKGKLGSSASPADNSSARGGKILVMDDEELIRDLAEELIGALGHEAEVAKNGEAALEMYQGALEAGNPFDAVILDLTIRGGLGGIETNKRLQAMDPKVKTVVSSGYSDDAMLSEYLASGFKACLKKPYGMDELRGVLNALLAGKAG